MGDLFLWVQNHLVANAERLAMARARTQRPTSCGQESLQEGQASAQTTGGGGGGGGRGARCIDLCQKGGHGRWYFLIHVDPCSGKSSDMSSTSIGQKQFKVFSLPSCRSPTWLQKRVRVGECASVRELDLLFALLACSQAKNEKWTEPYKPSILCPRPGLGHSLNAARLMALAWRFLPPALACWAAEFFYFSDPLPKG